MPLSPSLQRIVRSMSLGGIYRVRIIITHRS